MWSNSSFALFPLVDISVDKINSILDDAFKGTQFSINPFWLPSLDDYSDAPKKLPSNVTEGSKPPVPPTYQSPLIGKKTEDVAIWLKNKPEEAELDIHFFAVLDKTAKEGKVIIWRQGTPLKDMDVLGFHRLDAEFAAAELYTARLGSWEGVASSRKKAAREVQY